MAKKLAIETTDRVSEVWQGGGVSFKYQVGTDARGNSLGSGDCHNDKPNGCHNNFKGMTAGIIRYVTITINVNRGISWQILAGWAGKVFAMIALAMT